MTEMVTLIAFLHAKPERVADLEKIMHAFVEPTRKEAGCVEYHLHRSNDDPNLFVFYENWRSQEDLDKHLETPYLKSFFATRMEYLEKDVDLQFYTMQSEFKI
ncbi:MAG: putative quinol monooxygenase [Proteobacteria bacterium]|nr:putative quinol monooxygenase [Pseudomonadota bacterium]